MDLLEYLRRANTYETVSEPDLRVAIVTNFTDDLLAKLVTGMCLSNGLAPSVYQVPFKQYLFEFKNPNSPLVMQKPDVTFIFFDVNPYLESEFNNLEHVSEVLCDIDTFCKASSGTVVVHTLSSPTSVQHDRVLRNHDLLSIPREFNARLLELAEKMRNLYVIDTDRIVRQLGEGAVRDFRGLYAFAQPFKNEFLYSIAQEWMAHIRTLRGNIWKCIVLDLDNTLWGGVVGEVGVHSIQLGPNYPGNAYSQFQRTLLDLGRRGVMLAINSRNNSEDVEEVFEKNPHMILKKEHFVSIFTNWDSKADNLRHIAREANIGLDSLIFIDDDPANRELVRSQLPEVLVPEWSLPPEEYVPHLLGMDALHTLRLTDEDRGRGEMYSAERERAAVRTETPSLEEYLATLEVEIRITQNDPIQIPRVAQLTQKTNQFNLTTRRSTEKEVADWIESGSLVYVGDVRDKFGPYGVTIVAVVDPKDSKEAMLNTFLMSCRVMGRNVEKDFFAEVLQDLRTRGYETLFATFMPTAKNAPAKRFLSDMGGIKVGEGEAGAEEYIFNLHTL